MKVTEGDQLMTYDYCLNKKVMDILYDIGTCLLIYSSFWFFFFEGVNFILFSLRSISIERNDEK